MQQINLWHWALARSHETAMAVFGPQTIYKLNYANLQVTSNTPTLIRVVCTCLAAIPTAPC